MCSPGLADRDELLLSVLGAITHFSNNILLSKQRIRVPGIALLRNASEKVHVDEIQSCTFMSLRVYE